MLTPNERAIMLRPLCTAGERDEGKMGTGIPGGTGTGDARRVI